MFKQIFVGIKQSLRSAESISATHSLVVYRHVFVLTGFYFWNVRRKKMGTIFKCANRIHEPQSQMDSIPKRVDVFS